MVQLNRIQDYKINHIIQSSMSEHLINVIKLYTTISNVCGFMYGLGTLALPLS